MILTITPGEPMGRALGRLARALLARAADILNDEGEPASERIHEMRTTIKKVRAVMRLARPLAARQEWRGLRRAQRRLRHLAGCTAALRDAEVVMKTLDKIVAAGPRDLAPAALEGVRQQLLQQFRLAEQDFRASGPSPAGRRGPTKGGRSPLRTLAELLTRERRRTHDWAPSRPRTWSKAAVRITDEMARTYRRARRSMKCAYAEQARQTVVQAERAAGADRGWKQTGAAFHEWRKAVKAHRYQLQLLAGTWPASLMARLPELERLGDLLGEEHDLTVLRQTLADCPTCLEDRRARDSLQALLAVRQRRLREEARTLGEPLFRERTRHFRRDVKQAMRGSQARWPPASVANAGTSGQSNNKASAHEGGLGKLTAV